EHWRENYRNRYALASGEIARIEGRDLDAMRLYEEAIRSAHENDFVQNEALASELAGRFYLARGLDTGGYAPPRNARGCYAPWGAGGKGKEREAQYPAGAAPGRAALHAQSRWRRRYKNWTSPPWSRPRKRFRAKPNCRS